MGLILRNISLRLTPFTLEVNAELHGRITVVFGPSGAGKTSLLELVAGLRRAQSAFVQLDGQVLTDTSHHVSVATRKRGIGYVPQDLALFPHLSVRKNILYGAKADGETGGRLSLGRVVEILEIQSLVERRVTELSGGEKQRVALARALLASPRLLLLDEPLASLDRQLKARIIPYLARIRDEFHIPMLYVTHDRHELLALADEMLVLVEGKVTQMGPVREVLSRPANLAVAGLLAVETIQPARIVKRAEGLVTVAVGSVVSQAGKDGVQRIRGNALATSPIAPQPGADGASAAAKAMAGQGAPVLPIWDTTVGSVLLTAVESNLPANASEVYVCIRAEDVILVKGGDSPSSARNHLAGVVQSVASDGPLVRVELDCGFMLAALVTKHAVEEMALQAGDRVVALVKAPHLHLIPR